MNLVQRISVHISGSSGGASVLSSEEGLSRFVELQLGDFTVGGVDGDLRGRAVLLGSNDLIDVDGPSSSVDSEDLAGLSLDSVLFGPTLDLDGVSLPDWERPDRVLGLEFFAQVAAHHLSSQSRAGGEVSLSRLSSLAGNT